MLRAGDLHHVAEQFLPWSFDVYLHRLLGSEVAAVQDAVYRCERDALAHSVIKCEAEQPFRCGIERLLYAALRGRFHMWRAAAVYPADVGAASGYSWRS